MTSAAQIEPLNGAAIRLYGRTALVTGAAGAIGVAICRALADAGAFVIMSDIEGDALTRFASAFGSKAATFCFDLSDLEGIPSAMESLERERGAIDILVNNAGVLSNNKMADTDLREWRRIHAVNIDAAFLLSKSLLKGMRARRWGRIVNISSYAAKCGGLTAGTAYSVSKSAMVGLTFSIARETAHQGITVNAIAPAYVMSPMVSAQLSAGQRAEQLAQIPVARFCAPEEVAHAVLFLASPLAGFVTGEVIDMNGGLQFD